MNGERKSRITKAILRSSLIAINIKAILKGRFLSKNI